MKIKRLATLAVAATMVVGTLTGATAADSYPGFLMFADGSWQWSNFALNGEGSEVGAGQDVNVTGDGTYTVTLTKADLEAAGRPYGDAEGVTVCCVDIEKLAEDIGAGSEDLDKSATAADKRELVNDAGVTVSDVVLKADGKEVLAIDNSELIYGDIEGNGKLRIEIWNAYGETGGSDGKADPIYESPDLKASDNISVTFTISGLSEDSSSDSSKGSSSSDSDDTVTIPSNDGDTEVVVSDNQSAGTAAATGDSTPIAMALAVIAAASVVVVLKKKEVNE